MAKRSNLPSKHLSLLPFIISSTVFSSTSFANDYLESAQKYLVKQETNAAIIELKNAIKASPESGTARYLLGKIFFEQGAFSSAEQHLSRALKYNYDKDIVAPLIARSLINQNKLDDAFLLIKELYPLANQTPTNLLALAAMAETKANNLESAKAFLASINETNFYSEFANILYLFATKEKEQALMRVTNLVESNNKENDLWLLKGHIETSLGQAELALNSYTTAYKLAPRASQYSFYIARSLIELNRFEKATPIIDNLLKSHGQNAYLNELKAITSMVNKDYSKAKLHADKSLNNGLSNFRLLSISSVAAFHLGQIERSYKTFKKLAPELPNNHPINQLYIITQFKLGYIDEAIENLNAFPIESNLDSQFISKISVELTKIGRSDLALKFAKRAANTADDQTETVLNFVKLANNDPSGMKDLLASIEKQPNADEAKQGIVNYYLGNRMFDKAKTLADQWLKNNPNDIVALTTYAIAHKYTDKPAIAKSYFEKVKSLEPTNLQALIELAKFAAMENNHELASSLLIQAKKIEPSNHRINKVFLEHHKKTGDLAKAIKIIDEQVKAEPLNIQLKIQKANALAIQGDIKSGILLLESLPTKDVRVWKTLSSMYLAIKDRKSLQNSYQEWLKIDKFNPTAYLRNIRFLLEENALFESLKITNQAQKIFAEDARFNLAKAEILLKQGKIEEAKLELTKLPESFTKNNIDFHQIQGLIHIANKDFNAAIDNYEKRFELKPNSKVALELALIYISNQQPEKAISFLAPLVRDNNFETKNNDFMKLKSLFAELNFADNPDIAIQVYSEILAIQPENVLVLNNLSWLLFKQDKIAQACSFAQKAHQLASKSANIADTYGYCLLKNGETVKALNLLEFAHEGKKENAQIALHFVEALIKAEQINKAAQVLAKIVTTVPELVTAKNSLEKTLVSLTQ